MSTLFCDLDRTATAVINCSTGYSSASPNSCAGNQQVSSVVAAAAAAVSASACNSNGSQTQQQIQQQQQQQLSGSTAGSIPTSPIVCSSTVAAISSSSASSMSGGSPSMTMSSQSPPPNVSQSHQQHSQHPQPSMSPDRVVGGIPSSLVPITTATSMSMMAAAAGNGISTNAGGGAGGNGGVNNLVEDQRALQLAFELSMVGLSDVLTQGNTFADLTNVVVNHQQQQSNPSGCGGGGGGGQNGVNGNGNGIGGVGGPGVGLGGGLTNGLPPGATISSFASILPNMEDRSKKSQNMTECVPVPSSEHVAEIVGRQGCKIKALRAKTNTYIKTPVRGEEPVFVVTGRKEDVGKAKREILSAAEHFSLIRASRKPALAGALGGLNGNGGTGGNGNGLGNNGGKGAPPGPPTNIPGQVTIQVRVPYRVVGLVVGPKGATIKHIQQQTQTYIVTPSRDKEPIFEVTGMPDNVQSARRQIEAHIALRTGNLSLTPAAAAAAGVNGGLNSTGSSGSGSSSSNSNGIGSLLGDDAASSEFLASLYKNGFGSLLGYLDPTVGIGSGNGPPSGGGNGSIGIGNGSNACRNGGGLSLTGNGISIDTCSSLNSAAGGLMNGNGGGGGGMIGNGNGNGGTNGPMGIIASSMNIGGLNIGTGGGSVVNASSLNGMTCNEITAMANSYAPVPASSTGSRSCSSSSSSTSSKSATNSRPELMNIWKSLGGDSIDVDEGIGESPNIWSLPVSSSTLGSRCSPSTTSVSPTDSLLGSGGGGGGGGNIGMGGIGSINGIVGLNGPNGVGVGLTLNCVTNMNGCVTGNTGNNGNGNGNVISAAAVAAQAAAAICRRECLVCGDKEVTAALVPCGHNMFCMDCATRVCGCGDGICPVCSQNVVQAIRIIP